MKLLLLSSQFNEYMIELANALSETHDVTLSMPENSLSKKHISLLKKSVNLKPFLFVDFWSIRQNLKMFISVRNIIKSTDPEIIHIQSFGYRTLWLQYFLLRRRNLFNTIHDPLPHSGDILSKRHRLNEKILNSITKGVFVHGNSLIDDVIYTHGIERENIKSIFHGHLGIYKNWSKGYTERQENSFLFFGRIWPYKGLNYFIRAANIVVKKYPDTSFVIAGKGESIESYTELIECPKNFQILNKRLNEQEIDEIFQRSNSTVLPYTDATQSGVIPIAFAYKTIVIASEVGALPEVISDFRTGLLFESKNVSILADKMIWVIENRLKSDEIRNNSHELIMNDLSWNSVARETSKFYQNRLRI